MKHIQVLLYFTCSCLIFVTSKVIVTDNDCLSDYEINQPSLGNLEEHAILQPNVRMVPTPLPASSYSYAKFASPEQILAPLARTSANFIPTMSYARSSLSLPQEAPMAFETNARMISAPLPATSFSHTKFAAPEQILAPLARTSANFIPTAPTISLAKKLPIVLNPNARMIPTAMPATSYSYSKFVAPSGEISAPIIRTALNLNTVPSYAHELPIAASARMISAPLSTTLHSHTKFVTPEKILAPLGRTATNIIPTPSYAQSYIYPSQTLPMAAQDIACDTSETLFDQTPIAGNIIAARDSRLSSLPIINARTALSDSSWAQTNLLTKPLIQAKMENEENIALETDCK